MISFIELLYTSSKPHAEGDALAAQVDVDDLHLNVLMQMEHDRNDSVMFL